MKLLSKIMSGKQPACRRVMVYGTHGIGKSTFGAMSDQPIFIQTEDGLPYHIVYIDDQEQQDPIPIALFGYERAIEEQEIQIEGILENRNGYPSVTVIQVEGVAKRVPQPKIAGQRQPPPEVRRPDRPFTGRVNRDGGPEGDELPF